MTETVMLVNMGNCPHCDHGEGLASRPAPYPLFSLANQTGGCASLAPGYSLRPLTGPAIRASFRIRKEDGLGPTVLRVGNSQALPEDTYFRKGRRSPSSRLDNVTLLSVAEVCARVWTCFAANPKIDLSKDHLGFICEDRFTFGDECTWPAEVILTTRSPLQ